jgi:hypothetical protein
MTVCLVLEFGIRLLDRSNGPVLMIPFCRSTKEADRVLARANWIARAALTLGIHGGNRRWDDTRMG